MRSRRGDLSDQGVSLLSLFPHLIKRSLHVCVVSVGVAGWNTSAAGFRTCWYRFGTLLGPEETPVLVGGFLGAASGSAVLTRADVRGGGGGPGCGCVLSVA